MEFGLNGNALVLINEVIYATLSPVSTGMGDRVWVRLPGAALYFSI